MILPILIILFMIFMTWSTLSSNNPITLRLIILIVAICSSIIIRILVSTWHAIILFLIYIGGIIVIFSYFVGFSSNDSIWLKRKLQFTILPLIIIKTTYLQITIPRYRSSQIFKLYNTSNILIIIIITLILLFIIIIVIKIVKKNDAPLRGYVN